MQRWLTDQVAKHYSLLLIIRVQRLLFCIHYYFYSPFILLLFIELFIYSLDSAIMLMITDLIYNNYNIFIDKKQKDRFDDVKVGMCDF